MSSEMIANAVRELKGVWPVGAVRLFVKRAGKGLVHESMVSSFFAKTILGNETSLFGEMMSGSQYAVDLVNWHSITLEDFEAFVEVIGDWRDTLTLPPAKTEVAFKSSELRRLEVGEDLTAAQERTGKPIVSEVSTTNEADLWYINKELPPVGTKCIYVGGGKTKTAYIVAHHVDGKRAIWTEEGFKTGKLLYAKAENFRPIQTDREKFIEACAKAADGERAMVTVFGKMFDSGEFFYKPKDPQE